MNERQAREATLLQAFESAEAGSTSWTDEDRRWVDRVALEAVGSAAPTDVGVLRNSTPPTISGVALKLASTGGAPSRHRFGSWRLSSANTSCAAPVHSPPPGRVTLSRASGDGAGAAADVDPRARARGSALGAARVADPGGPALGRGPLGTPGRRARADRPDPRVGVFLPAARPAIVERAAGGRGARGPVARGESRQGGRVRPDASEDDRGGRRAAAVVP